MVNTIGEIAVSLSINKTGQLANLQKQLETIIGPKGEKDPVITAELDPKLLSDLTYIRRKIDFLLPPKQYGSTRRAQFFEEMAGVLNNLRRNSDELKERIRNMPERDWEKFIRMHGLEGASKEEIDKKLDEILAEWDLYMSNILDKKIANIDVERFKSDVRKFIGESGTDLSRVWGAVRKIDQDMKENNPLWERMMRALGVLKEGQVPYRGFTRQMEKLLQENEDFRDYVEKEFDLEDIDLNDTSVKEIREQLQILPGKELTLSQIVDIMESREDIDEKQIVSLVRVAIKEYIEGNRENIILPRKFFLDHFDDIQDQFRKNSKDLDDILDMNYDLTTFFEETRPDLELSLEKYEEIKNDLPPFFVKHIEKLRNEFGPAFDKMGEELDMTDEEIEKLKKEFFSKIIVEVKNQANKTTRNINQLHNYVSAVGDNLIYVARGYSDQMMNELESLDVEFGSVRPYVELQKKGLQELIPDEKLESFFTNQADIIAQKITGMIEGIKLSAKEKGEEINNEELMNKMISLIEMVKGDSQKIDDILSELVRTGAITKEQSKIIKEKTGFG